MLFLGVMLAVTTYGQSDKAQTNDIQTKEVLVLVKVFDEKGKTTATIDFEMAHREWYLLMIRIR